MGVSRFDRHLASSRLPHASFIGTTLPQNAPERPGPPSGQRLTGSLGFKRRPAESARHCRRDSQPLLLVLHSVLLIRVLPHLPPLPQLRCFTPKPPRRPCNSKLLQESTELRGKRNSQTPSSGLSNVQSPRKSTLRFLAIKSGGDRKEE